MKLFPSSSKSPGDSKLSPSKQARKMSRLFPVKSPTLPANMDPTTISELFCSVHNFLRASNCVEAANALRDELDRKHLLAPRINPFQSGTLPETFDHFSANRGSGVVDLVEAMSRLGELVNTNVPVKQDGPMRLAASKPFSVARRYPDEIDRVPRPDMAPTPELLPFRPLLNRSMLRNQRLGLPIRNTVMLSNESASSYKHHARIYGHHSSIYCVTFDRSGQFVITGADDNLIKVWDAKKCLLRYTFRGHAAEVCDLSVSHENTLLVSGSLDRTVRVWSLQNGAALEVFTGHTHNIVSVLFPPFFQEGYRYLISLSYDCCVIFYRWNAETKKFDDKKEKFTHKAQGQHKLLSGTTSSGGNFAAFSDSQKNIYVYLLKVDNVFPIATLRDVHGDKIDSLVWCHQGLRFMSASSDGIIRVWNFTYNQYQPTDLKLPETDLPTTAPASKKSAYQVNTICWSLDDQYVVASGSDNLLRIWNPRTAKLVGCLKGHEKVVFVLRPHPTNPDLVCSAGYDGFCMIWDLGMQKCIKKIVNLADVNNKLHSVYDLAFSPNGLMMAFVDDVGHVTFTGILPNESAKRVPKQQFFSSDYMPCEADARGFPRDATTGLAPHLNNPPELVRVDNIPYDVTWQNTVPGRSQMLAHPGGLIEGFFCPWLYQNIVEPEADISPFVKKSLFYAEHHLKEYESEKERIPPVDWEAVPLALNAPKKPPIARRRAPPANEAPPVVPLSLADQAALLPDSDSDDGTYTGEDSDLRSPSPFSGLDPLDVRDDLLFDDENDSDYVEGYDAHDTVFRNTNRRRRRPEPEPPAPVQPASQPTTSRPRRERVERQNSDPRDTTRATASRPRPVGRHTRANPAPADDPLAAAQRRRQRQRRARIASEAPEDEAGVAEPRAPVAPSPPIQIDYPEWTRQLVTRRFPYLAQIGDHVVYFPQGHTNYLSAVKQKRLFKVSHGDYPKPEFNCEEFAIVDDLEYVIEKKTHLTVLTLSLTDANGQRNNRQIKVRYHDLENVPDFMILREYFDQSVAFEFKTGDIVEAIIDEKWWIGTVEERSLINQGAFSGAQFCSVKVLWGDNGEDAENCSPWDLQPVTPGRVSEVDATVEEILAFSAYTPRDVDWPVPEAALTDEYTVAAAIDWHCTRFSAAVEALCEIPDVLDFRYPVDLNVFPFYAFHVPYPMCLEKILMRLQNRYYRTKWQLLRDIQLLAFNANKFNEPSSMIAINSIRLVETLFAVLHDASVTDFVQHFMHLLELGDAANLQAWKRSLSLTPANPDVDMSGDGPSSSNNSGAHHDAEVWEAESRRILSQMITPDLRDALGPEEYDDLLNRFPDGDVNDPAQLLVGVNALIQQTQNSLPHRRDPLYVALAALSSELDHAFRPVIEKYHRMRNGGRQLRAAALTTSVFRRSGGGGNNMRTNAPTMNLRQRVTRMNYNLDTAMQPDLPRRRTLRRGQEIPNYAEIHRGSIVDDDYGLPRPSSSRRIQNQVAQEQPSSSTTRRRQQVSVSPAGSNSSVDRVPSSSNSTGSAASRRSAARRSVASRSSNDNEEAEDVAMVESPPEVVDEEVPAVESPSSRANDSDYNVQDAEVEDEEDDEDDGVPEPRLSSESEASANSEDSTPRTRRNAPARRAPARTATKRRRQSNTEDELDELLDDEESSLTEDGSSDGSSPTPSRKRTKKKKTTRRKPAARSTRRRSSPEAPPSRKRRRPARRSSDESDGDEYVAPTVTRSGRVNRRTARYQ
uniref:Bromo domain-containing protein n=1 Tax=Panagrellus redivivus TaxID=6233 RepID=A0A7E4V464_PANRE